MKKEKYSFRKQVNGRGLYTEFEYSVLSLDHQRLRIESDLSEVEREWRQAVEVGLNLFYSYFVQTKHEAIKVVFHKFSWMPADTNHVIVIYAVVDALSKTMAIDIPNLKFDPDKSLFVFPDPRSIQNIQFI